MSFVSGVEQGTNSLASRRLQVAYRSLSLLHGHRAVERRRDSQSLDAAPVPVS